MICGGIVGVAPAWLSVRAVGERMTLADGVKAGLIGAVSGVLPDIMEPPTSPQHRSLFHSYAAGAGGAYAIYKLRQLPIAPETEKVVLAALSGYASHLILDSQTPSGLPFAG